MKRRMEVSQHCWKFIYKHSDISIFAVCHRFFIFFYLHRRGKNIFTNKFSSSGIYRYLIAAWEGLKGNILWVNNYNKKKRIHLLSMKILYRGIFIATFKRTYIQDQARPIIVTSLLSYETSPIFPGERGHFLQDFWASMNPDQCVYNLRIK